MMSLLWYYRPEHTQGGRNPSMHQVSHPSVKLRVGVSWYVCISAGRGDYPDYLPAFLGGLKLGAELLF